MIQWQNWLVLSRNLLLLACLPWCLHRWRTSEVRGERASQLCRLLLQRARAANHLQHRVRVVRVHRHQQQFQHQQHLRLLSHATRQLGNHLRLLGLRQLLFRNERAINSTTLIWLRRGSLPQSFPFALPWVVVLHNLSRSARFRIHRRSCGTRLIQLVWENTVQQISARALFACFFDPMQTHQRGFLISSPDIGVGQLVPMAPDLWQTMSFLPITSINVDRSGFASTTAAHEPKSLLPWLCHSITLSVLDVWQLPKRARPGRDSLRCLCQTLIRPSALATLITLHLQR